MGQLLQQGVSADAPKQKPTKESYRPFLRDVYLFSGFPDEALTQLLDNMQVKSLSKKQSLFITGDAATHFYIVVNGWIKLYRETRDGHETVIAMFTNTDIFGRSAVMKNAEYMYSAQAETDCELLSIPSGFMHHMADNHTHFDHFLTKFLDGERADFNQKGLEVEHMAHMTSAERLGCFLLRLCAHQKEGSFELQLPYEKSLVAGRLGMTPETFSRSLNQLSAFGVETHNSMVKINNIEQLQLRICERCSALKSECERGDEA
jgi:CRP-like cAMP-binding protein